MTPAAIRQAEPDQACAEAVDLARLAAEEVAGLGEVGAHVGVEADGERVATHFFACLSSSYVGWRWAVTVARASRSRQVTVSESLLLPGPDSLLAPQWVPWTERVRPGDMRAGDLMPAAADDERLIPTVVIEGAEGLLDWDTSDAWTLGADLPAAGSGAEPGGGLETAAADPDSGAAVGYTGGGIPEAAGGPGRQRGPQRRRRGRADGTARPLRVLSAIGRDEAAERWYLGDHGPKSQIAMAAPDYCMTCGFLVRLGGPLGRIFGVCANEYSPADGEVVAFDFGCGAHSDPGRRTGGPDLASGQSPAREPAEAEPAVDEIAFDMVTGQPEPDQANLE